MKYFLNSGFGSPLPTDDLALIRSLGYEGVRQNIPTEALAPSLLDNLLDAGLHALCILPVEEEDTCHLIAHALARRAVERQQGGMVVLEVGNEEDLSGKRWARDPRAWAALVADISVISSSHSSIAPGGPITVVSGGVSSVSRQAMGWLERSRVRELPVSIGYHQYRSTPPSHPLDGYSSRADEFRTLRDAAGDLETWMTESGWHTARRTSGTWPLRKKWAYSDTQVAEFLREEMSRNEEVGARCFVTYQLNDGPDPSNDQDCFGIRRTDGSLKPSAWILSL